MISLIASNDVRRELRDPVGIASAVLVGAGTVIALRVALAGTSTPSPLLAAGALWIGLLFGNLLAVGRPIAEELEAGTLEALVSAPGGRSQIFFGKTIGAAIIGFIVQVLVIGVFAVGFAPLSGAADIALLVLALVLAAAGFAASGVVVGLLALRARGRGPLAATLMLPLSLPLVVAGVLAALPAFGGTGGKAIEAMGFMALYLSMLVAIGIALTDDLVVE